MAGSNPDFDSADFKSGIRFAWTMAEPINSQDQISFFFPTVKTYDKTVDQSGVPFDPTATFTSSTPDPISLTVGVKYKDGSNVTTPFDDASPRTIDVTMFDDDYAQIQGCEGAILGGVRYILQSTAAPSGLFNVGIYTLSFASEGTN